MNPALRYAHRRRQAGQCYSCRRQATRAGECQRCHSRRRERYRLRRVLVLSKVKRQRAFKRKIGRCREAGCYRPVRRFLLCLLHRQQMARYKRKGKAMAKKRKMPPGEDPVIWAAFDAWADAQRIPKDVDNWLGLWQTWEAAWKAGHAAAQG